MITRRKFLVHCLNTGVALSLTQRTSLWSEWLSLRTEPLRVGIIGLGDTGLCNLQRCLTTDQVAVSALCDLRPEALGLAANRLEKVKQTVPAYSDYRTLLTRPDVHAVTVAVPTHERASIVAAACNAGKHVYVGPLWAATVSDSEQILKLANSGTVLVYQDRVDDEWDTDTLCDFMRDGRSAPLAMHVTLYRGETEALSEPQSLRDTFDQMGLAQKLLDTELPRTVSAVQGLVSVEGPRRLTTAIRLDFKDGGESKSLIVQKGFTPNDRLLAHIATTHSNERRFEYVVELSENDAGLPQSGWRSFLATLHKQPNAWISMARNTHISNSYILLGEQALKRGTIAL